MKTFCVLFLIFCISVGQIKCKATIEELKKSMEVCLEEFNSTEVNPKSTEMEDDACFITCVNIKVGIIKDNKFDLERNAEFIHLIEDAEYAAKMIDAYEYCVSKMPKFEDECALSAELEDCVDLEIGTESSESEEE